MMPKTRTDIQMRWTIRSDMPKVLEIERLSFPNPYTEQEFIQLLKQRDFIGQVAEIDKTVVGFVIYQLAKGVLRIVDIAVHSDYRHQGIGTQIIDKMKSKLQIGRRSLMTADVRETNLAAQLFFRSQGLKALAILENTYTDTDEDAYVMAYNLEAKIAPQFVPRNRIEGMV